MNASILCKRAGTETPQASSYKATSNRSTLLEHHNLYVVNRKLLWSRSKSIQGKVVCRGDRVPSRPVFWSTKASNDVYKFGSCWRQAMEPPGSSAACSAPCCTQKAHRPPQDVASLEQRLSGEDEAQARSSGHRPGSGAKFCSAEAESDDGFDFEFEADLQKATARRDAPAPSGEFLQLQFPANCRTTVSCFDGEGRGLRSVSASAPGRSGKVPSREA